MFFVIAGDRERNSVLRGPFESFNDASQAGSGELLPVVFEWSRVYGWMTFWFVERDTPVVLAESRAGAMLRHRVHHVERMANGCDNKGRPSRPAALPVDVPPPASWNDLMPRRAS